MLEPADFHAQLEALRDAYAAQLPEKLKQIELAWQQLTPDKWDEEGFQALHRLVHSLTGSGKTFGWSMLSDKARNLEEYLQQLGQTRKVPNTEQRQEIEALLHKLH